MTNNNTDSGAEPELHDNEPRTLLDEADGNLLAAASLYIDRSGLPALVRYLLKGILVAVPIGLLLAAIGWPIIIYLQLLE